ncbi:MAG TPA: hypothetical protein VG900_04110 [Hyphomicrobiaceae bacterium]|jgi:hypothetical protein|nr:hypothetical protein [Hyphomicrobiaceae bacterium]
MNRLLALVVVPFLAVGPVHAASPKVEAAIQAVSKIPADTAKFQGYCALLTELDAAGEEGPKVDEVQNKLSDFMQSMGPDVAAAWALYDELEPESEDGKALAAAFEALDEKCP